MKKTLKTILNSALNGLVLHLVTAMDTVSDRKTYFMPNEPKTADNRGPGYPKLDLEPVVPKIDKERSYFSVKESSDIPYNMAIQIMPQKPFFKGLSNADTSDLVATANRLAKAPELYPVYRSLLQIPKEDVLGDMRHKIYGSSNPYGQSKNPDGTPKSDVTSSFVYFSNPKFKFVKDDVSEEMVTVKKQPMTFP